MRKSHMVMSFCYNTHQHDPLLTRAKHAILFCQTNSVTETWGCQVDTDKVFFSAIHQKYQKRSTWISIVHLINLVEFII